MEDTVGWQKHKPDRTGPFMFRPPSRSTVSRLTLCQRFVRWRILTWTKVTGPIRALLRCPRPAYHGFRLLWPIPWYFSVPLQLSEREWIGNEELLMRRKTYDIDYTALRKLALFRARDTPLCCIYRLYEAICASSRNELMEESHYYFHYQPRWKLKDIPDPKDTDPQRQAILASLVETLVQSFNFKIGMGLRRGITHEQPWLIEHLQRETDLPYEEAPGWTSQVGPLTEPLKMHPDPLTSPWKHFTKRHIFANADALWNF